MRGRPGLLRPLATGIALVAAGCSFGGSSSTSPARPEARDCPPPRALPAAAEPRPQYRLDVRLVPARRLVFGRMRVSFPATAPTDRLVFRLWPNGPLERRHGARLDLGAVSVDGRRAQTTRPDPTTLVVHVDRRLEPGDSVVASLGFGLVVPHREPGFPDRLQARADWMRLGSFFPILAWDGEHWKRDPPPRIPGESATSPIADFDVTIDGPRGWTAVATGEPAGGGRFVARAVRDFALTAGRLDLTQTTVDAGRRVKIVLATVPGLDPEVPPATLQRAAASLERLSDLYGPYPWPRFTVSLYPDLRTNGIEYPTHVAVGPGSVPVAVPHETAHQWFYSLVGNNQGADPWLDEGVATWAGSRVDPGANLFRGIPLGQDVEGRLGEGMPYWNRQGDGDYFRGVYVQGAKALESLGPARLVDCALRGYVAANAYRVADVDDLATALERVFPNARAVLDRFGAFEGR